MRRSTDNSPLQSIVILGGDSIGCMIAAALANSLRGSQVSIVQIIGPGEDQEERAWATLPGGLSFHQQMGMDESEFMSSCQATFRLGTLYQDWLRPGHSQMLPLSEKGSHFGIIPFHHFALERHLAGDPAPLNAYSMTATAATQKKFNHPVGNPGSALASLVYAHHFDGRSYGRLMSNYAVSAGVKTVHGTTTGVDTDEDGFIDRIILDSGETVRGDLFIDCSGEQATLIGDTLSVEHEDWSSWQPWDTVLTARSSRPGDLPPYTTVKAHELGWLRQIPLRHGFHNELVFSSAHVSKDQAALAFKSALGAAQTGDMSTRTQAAGPRKAFWKANCVALGRAAGEFGTTEISELDMAQRGVMRLATLLPNRDCNPLIAAEFNRQQIKDYLVARDFLVHRCAGSQRKDPGFWADCNDLPAPESLARRNQLFASHGRLPHAEKALIASETWAASYLGLEQFPRGIDPLVDSINPSRVEEQMLNMRGQIAQAAASMATHQQYLDGYCKPAKRDAR